MAEQKATKKKQTVEHDIVIDVYVSLEEQKLHAKQKASEKLNGLDMSKLKVLETTQRQAQSGGGMFCKVAVIE